MCIYFVYIVYYLYVYIYIYLFIDALITCNVCLLRIPRVVRNPRSKKNRWYNQPASPCACPPRSGPDLVGDQDGDRPPRTEIRQDINSMDLPIDLQLDIATDTFRIFDPHAEKNSRYLDLHSPSFSWLIFAIPVSAGNEADD